MYRFFSALISARCILCTLGDKQSDILSGGYRFLRNIRFFTEDKQVNHTVGNSLSIFCEMLFSFTFNIKLLFYNENMYLIGGILVRQDNDDYLHCQPIDGKKSIKLIDWTLTENEKKTVRFGNEFL